MSFIRPIALCVFRHEGRILLAYHDTPIIGYPFYRPVGGTIEFGEDSLTAVIREVREEIKAEITRVQLLGVLENIFTHRGEVGHEYAHIYEARFIKQQFYEYDVVEGVDDDRYVFEARWVEIGDLSRPGSPPLYPDGLLELLQQEHKPMTKQEQYNAWIDTLRHFPDQLTKIVSDLTDEQLHARPEPEGWTVAEIVHHCADSHMNSFIRLKLISTEDNPPLKGYDQDAWVLMADEGTAPIEPSLTILRGLHQRWVTLFESLSGDDWTRVGLHSEDGPVSAEDLLRLYDQHCRVHLAQIRRVLSAQN